jgi:hypothetical protein
MPNSTQSVQTPILSPTPFSKRQEARDAHPIIIPPTQADLDEHDRNVTLNLIDNCDKVMF